MSDTQDEPAMEQNIATDQERLDGIIAQLRGDLTDHDAATVEQSLRRRLGDAGLVLDEGQIADLVAAISAD